jgi:hypothetical protein
VADTGVYMIGLVGQIGLVRKYSVDGNELWSRQLEFSSTPGGLAVDATGVYVAGRDFPPNSSYLRKYSPDGAEVWTRRFGDGNNPENPHGVSVDATGVYMFGLAARYGPSAPPPELAFFSFVRKWDLSGSELWTRQVHQSVNVPSAAGATGFYLVSGSGRSYSVIKYDAGGNEVWTRQIGTSSGQFYLSSYYISAVTADETGV